jgi:23S rRNA (uracil1939-C5)-methyltransferase
LGYRTLGIEENPQAIADAQLNARKNNLQEQATFIAARVEDSREAVPIWARSPELIVVNPSRRGLADTTRKHLARLLAMFPESRFLYVSCEAETLARDLVELTSTGFQVRQVEPFDMFPQTEKMEWVAVLTR